MIDILLKITALIIFGSPFILCAALLGVTVYEIIREVRDAR